MLVADTNILSYWLRGDLIEELPREKLVISVVTEIELLSFPSSDPSDESGIRSLLGDLSIIPLTDTIKLCAIRLRKAHRLKLPDAIIAGTAMALQTDLLSNDSALARIPGLKCRKMDLKPAP